MLQWLQKMEREFQNQTDISTNICVFSYPLFLVHILLRKLSSEKFSSCRWNWYKFQVKAKKSDPPTPLFGTPSVSKTGLLFSVWCQGNIPASERNQSLTNFFFFKKSWKNILGDHIENFQSFTINHLCYKSIIFSYDWILGPFILLKSMIPNSPFFVRGLPLSLQFPIEVQKLRNICGIFTPPEDCDLFCNIILLLERGLKMLTFAIAFYLYIIPVNWN